MATASIATQYAYDRESGQRIEVGQPLTSFRGEEWAFAGVSRWGTASSTGRVAVMRLCPESYLTETGVRECVHAWHVRGIERTEYFPSVFGLYLADIEGNEV